MGDALVIVEKTYGGETWANVHCLRVGGAGGPVVDADMTALGVATPITATNTAAGATVNPLTRILAFERALIDPVITVSRVYVTDGLRNDLTTPDYFWSSALTLPGNIRASGAVGPETIAPAGITLMLNKVPVGFSSRVGRMFIRGALLDGTIRFNGRGGLDWQDAATIATYTTAVNNAITNSALNTMFNGGSNATVALYCIPHFQSPKTAPTKHLIGSLIGATPCVNIVVGSPVLRQVKRGKKRKAATATV